MIPKCSLPAIHWLTHLFCIRLACDDICALTTFNLLLLPNYKECYLGYYLLYLFLFLWKVKYEMLSILWHLGCWELGKWIRNVCIVTSTSKYESTNISFSCSGCVTQYIFKTKRQNLPNHMVFLFLTRELRNFKQLVDWNLAIIHLLFQQDGVVSAKWIDEP